MQDGKKTHIDEKIGDDERYKAIKKERIMQMEEKISPREINSAFSFIKQKGASSAEAEHARKVMEGLLEKNMPRETILGAVLKEAKGNFAEEIKEKFGTETARITEEIYRIEQIVEKNYSKLDPNTLSSIVLSIPQDFQPIIIKMAELAYILRYESQTTKRMAMEAQEIFLPIAIKLGLQEYAWKIQDFSFKVLEPEAFDKINKLVSKRRTERERVIREVVEEVKELLKGKISAEVNGRPKGYKAIHDKLKKVPFQKMHDLYGIRIICDKEKECYEALGYIHANYEIIPDTFDDYIAKPKADGYKSIHTAVRRGSDVIEVQIRTWEHHLRTVTERYWNYKKINKDKEFEKELGWERQLIEWQKMVGKEGLAKKMVGRKIFAFTPKNDAIALPLGASAIDFAFAVHTDVGRRMEKVKINGKYAPIETKLNNLDTVEIITSPKDQIKKSWLTSAASEKAKAKIKAEFNMQQKKKAKSKAEIKNVKKIKMAECCHPLPGEDVIGVKTTKRKIVVHKKECINVRKVDKSKLVEIGFEREKGQTEIKVGVIDRPGILGEILNEIRGSGAGLLNTSFKIKKSGYAEAIFGIEISSAAKLEKLLEKIDKIPGVQSTERV